jgi:hypothetical protein
MAIGLYFFLLSEYRILYWRIQGTIGLSDIGSGPQSIGPLDIGLRRKNYRLSTSGVIIGNWKAHGKYIPRYGF